MPGAVDGEISILRRVREGAATLAAVIRPSLSAPLCLALLAAAGQTLAQGVDARGSAPGATPGAAATRDARRAAGAEETEQKRAPWRGSTLLFDQSVTTQTLGLGQDYQSRNDLYEWWFAFKPRYFLLDNEKEALSVNLWMNLYLEFTNSDTTTTRREPVIGPTTLWASYAYTFYEQNGYRTAVSVGPWLTLPTDRAARNAGQLFGLGATGSATQSLPLARPGATALTSMRLGISTIFVHPFNWATTPVNGDIEQLRQDVAGRSIVSDQLRPGMNVANSLTLLFTTGVQLLPRLGFGVSYVLANSWTYAPKDVPICTVQPTCTEPASIGEPASFRVRTWALASLDYDAFDEMTVSLGYYNLTSQLGPDGQRRNPLYSPDARFFLTLTGNLDVIYDRLTTRTKPAPPTETQARR
ncbi:MAG TPA: hypothetical protein VK550_18545 [Polyangiaceae bacterium]|nr:hypothetical protein [Polyangiaceae bacterium]